MPLINLLKSALLAMTLTILLSVGIVGTANAASHLPDCKANPKCLLYLDEKWESLSAAEMQTMIDDGAYVNATDDNGWTPLHEAAYNGNAKVIPALVEAGADVNARDILGETPLSKAKFYKNPDAVSELEAVGGKTGTQIDQPVKKKYERKELSADGRVSYNFVYNPQCDSISHCVVIEAKAIEGCPSSLYMSLILFDDRKRNIGWTNAVARGLRKDESALLTFRIIEENVASYRVNEIECHR